MASQSERPAAAIVHDLGSSLADLLRQEARQGRDELIAKARQGFPGVMLLAGAGAFGVAASVAAGITAIRLWESVLPPRMAAAAAGVTCGAASASLLVVGINELRRLEALPQQTMQSLQDDLDAVIEHGDR